MAKLTKKNQNYHRPEPKERCETCKHMSKRRGFFHCFLLSENVSTKMVCDSWEKK